jgi:hypothetical protein
VEIINSIFTWVMKKRMHQIELFLKYPVEVQEELFQKLVDSAKDTQFGKEHDFKNIRDVQQFRRNIPVRNYEQIYPYIDKLLKGEQQVLWPSEVSWFAKSSGTTNARSKFIPVTSEALEDCHFKGGKDMISLYLNNYPDSKMFNGKQLVIGGSHQINQFDENSKSYYGDVSAVIIKNLPFWTQIKRIPSLDIALMSDWEEKIERMAEATSSENVSSIYGVPTWTVVLINRILEMKKAGNILEVWPNLELFVHGAVAFTPYRSLFRQLIPSPDMHYMETYNASEGFFGIQDMKNSDEMLLMLDYGVYYEFIPLNEINNDNPKAVSLDEVEIGKNYAMIITTNAGLWRYKIGDTIRFTSKYPFRFKISGRTKHFINAFGEELIIENAEEGITIACEKTGAVIGDYTAGPMYFNSGTKGGHEWIIEFKKHPDSLDHFVEVLDRTMRQLNSDYDAKRQKNLALQKPVVHAVREGTFYNWMKRRNKLGGQNKVPRLVNSREYLDDILKMIQNNN